MTNFETVERLRAKANVSYEEAKLALEEANWDLLDAMVILEKQGKVSEGQTASYSTKEEPEANTAYSAKWSNGVFARFGAAVVKCVNYLTRNSLEISRETKVLVTLPVIVPMILLLSPLFWLTIILFGVGLFTGFKYAFRGPDMGKDSINDAMSKASDVAENLKGEVKDEIHGDHNKTDD